MDRNLPGDRGRSYAPRFDAAIEFTTGSTPRAAVFANGKLTRLRRTTSIKARHRGK